MPTPFVKICCIANRDEAAMAIAAGATALGLVSAMPSGPGVISEDAIADVAAYAPPPISTFLLTSLVDADAIAAQHARCRTTTIQLVDAVAEPELVRLRRLLPSTKIVQVIHVTDESSVDEARGVAPFVDAILLDSGNQKLPVKELGGTGRTHDWRLSRHIVETAGVPVFLAGGLKASNVGDAITTVQPFGLDLCSSVRTDGKLDAAKLADFFRAVRSASAA
jgi:phosphoribosylanthranilate isomerase